MVVLRCQRIGSGAANPTPKLTSAIVGQSSRSATHHAGNVGRRNSPDLFGVDAMVVLSKNNPKSAYVAPGNIWVLHTKLLADRPGGFSNDFQETFNRWLECGILLTPRDHVRRDRQ